jgi:hypothetical protein
MVITSNLVAGVTFFSFWLKAGNQLLAASSKGPVTSSQKLKKVTPATRFEMITIH